MKSLLVKCAFVVTVYGASAAFGVSSADNLKLVAAHGLAESTPTHLIMEYLMKPRMEKYSDGRLELEVQGQGKLCSEPSCVEQARLGQIDIGATSGGNLGGFGSTFDIDGLPFLFESAEFNAELLNGWYGEYLKKNAAENQGLHVIAIIQNLGFRNIQNSIRAVHTPSDLEGIKLRVTKSPVELALIQGWGATAVPYDWSQIFEGLESGVINGMYIPNPYVAARGLEKVTSYITMLTASHNIEVYYMDKSRYEELPEWAKEVIDNVGAEIQEENYYIDKWEQAKMLEGFHNRAELYYPAEKEQKKWAAAAPAAWKKMKGRYDPEIARRILEEQGRTEFIKLLESEGVL